MLDSLFFGAFAMIIIYNLGYFVITNSATYASYFLFHLTLFIIMLFYTGMLEDTWFDFSMYGVPIGIFFLSVAMLLAFSRDFFELKILYPNLENYFNKLIVVNLVLLVISAYAISTAYLETFVINLVMFEAMGLLTFSAYLGFKKKNIFARFYFFSFLFLFIILIMVFMSYFSIIDVSQSVASLFEIAILLEAAGLSFALTYQHKEITLKLRQNELLFKELSHRVQNNLQQVISILTMQIGNTQDDAIKKYLKDTIKRIGSISLIHKILQNSLKVGKINMLIFLTSLINAYQGLNNNVKFQITCNKNIELDVDKLSSLALILNELITNSMKHAFKELEDAKIHIKLEENKLIHFTYEDNGIGFKKESIKSSVGSKLIDILARTQLKGKIFVDSQKRYFFSLVF